MKFLCTADWHIRKENPKYRIDNYLESLLDKVRYMVKRANELEARIVIAGDIFDSPRIGYAVSNALSEILRKANQVPLACFGNHDTTFHSQDVSNTPFMNLAVNGNIIFQSNYSHLCDNHSVSFTFVNWESGLPDTKATSWVNILVGHIPCYEKEVPFFMTSAHTPKTLKKLYPGFDYYITGDIHVPFCKDGVINPGSLCRANIDQVDYQPGYYILDTDTKEITRELIPVKPSYDVFNLEQKDLDTLKDVKALNEFIHTIKYTGDRPNFRNVLSHVVKEAEADQDVVDIINQTMEEI